MLQLMLTCVWQAPYIKAKRKEVVEDATKCVRAMKGMEERRMSDTWEEPPGLPTVQLFLRHSLQNLFP